MDEPSSTLRDNLRRALPGAMKAREPATVAALRSALAAIENAEAVVPGTPDDQGPAASPHVAGSAVGVGAAEAPRRELSEEEVLELVTRERDERLASAAAYRAAGRDEAARDLEQEAAALDAFLC